MNRHNSRPVTQNARGPDKASMASPDAMMAASDPMMTGLEPTRSSKNPPKTAPSAATTLAAIPKIRTSAGEIPYALTPSTPPNVNTPARPSRKTALAIR